MSAAPEQSAGLAHRFVRADAGTGKTYALAVRYLALLAQGVDPSRIVAITFTRKAASEILQRTLLRLADAVMNPEEAELLDAQIAAVLGAKPGASRGEPAGAADWLEGLVEVLPRLEISTLDAFFHRVASAFRFEMGLGRLQRVGAATDPAFEMVRSAAVEALLDERGRGESDLEALTELLSRLYRKEANRTVGWSLDIIVRELDSLYRESPQAATWRGASNRFASLPEGELASRLADLATLLQSVSTGHKSFDRALRLLVCDLEAARWDSAYSSTLGQRWLQEGDRLEFYNRALPAAIASRLSVPMEHAAAMLLRDQNERTRATHEVLRGFDGFWQPLLLRQGLATFDQLVERTAGFLRGDGPETGIEQVGTIEEESQEAASLRRSELAMRLLYRLDARVEHLLLDEFQDTSRLQWRALLPLVEEILAWGDGSRTLFAVGDPKQAIYGWRGGCAELFDLLEGWLREAGGALGELRASYRSAQPVIDTVNQVFDGLEEQPVFSDDLRPSAQRWAARFAEHETHRAELPGWVALETTGQWEGEFVDLDPLDQTRPGDLSVEVDVSEEDRPRNHLDDAAQRIWQLARCTPGSIGVLTATNRTASEILQRLRRLGLQVSAEGTSNLDDDPAVLAVLSALRLAQYPSDGASAFLLSHTDLGRRIASDLGLDQENWRRAQEPSLRARRLLSTLGPARLVARWRLLLLPHVASRTADRLRQLLEVAEAFEEENASSAGEFVSYALQQSPEDPRPARVRVMTVHKAKGLEFDSVVLCELERRLAAISNPIAETLREQEVAPPAAIHRSTNQFVRALSPDLQATREQELARRLQDDLSLLYVALTRSRSNLLLLVQPLANGSKGPVESKTFAGLLRHALCPQASLEQRAKASTVLYEVGHRPDFDAARSAPQSEPAAAPQSADEGQPASQRDDDEADVGSALDPRGEGGQEEHSEADAPGREVEPEVSEAGGAEGLDVSGAFSRHEEEMSTPRSEPDHSAASSRAPIQVSLFDSPSELEPESTTDVSSPNENPGDEGRVVESRENTNGAEEEDTASAPPAPERPLPSERIGVAASPSTLRPSQLVDPGPQTVEELFQLRPSEAALRGRLFHAWLARCQWLEPTTRSGAEDWPLDPQQRRQAVERLGVPVRAHLVDRWWEELREALRHREIYRRLVRPEKRRGEVVEVWTERSFATFRDQRAGGRSTGRDQLLRGTFDRVEVVRRSGQLVAARLLDYKTDAIGISDRAADSEAHLELIARYRPQLVAYREALAHMLQLLPTHVGADLVFLSSGRVLPVDGA